MSLTYRLPVSISLCLFLLLCPSLWTVALTATCGINPDPRWCQDSECFVMLEQAPYVKVDNKSNWDKLTNEGFECSKFRENKVDGIVMRLMEKVWKNRTLNAEGWRCYVGRKGCAFDEMVQWVGGNNKTETTAEETTAKENSWNLVMVGALLYTPLRRQMDLEFSVSIVDDELAVVARPREEDLEAASVVNKVLVLWRPFDERVWIAAASCMVLCVLAGGLLKFSHPSRRHRSGGIRQFHQRPSRRQILHNAMHTTAGALAVVFRVDGWEGDDNASDKDDKSDMDDDGNEGQGAARPGAAPHPVQQASYRLGLYNLVRLLLLLTLAFFYGTLLLFYQAALTNFLFQEGEERLAQSVTKLTDPQLQNYSVLRRSGVAEVWKGIQEENTNGYEAWGSCRDLDACFEEVRKADRRYLIVEKAIAKFRIHSRDLCGALTIFTPPENLYHFNAGLLFGPHANAALKQHINIHLLQDRLSDRIRQITAAFVPDIDCFPRGREIQWQQYIVPTALVIAVFSALIVGQVILILMNKKRPHEE